MVAWSSFCTLLSMQGLGGRWISKMRWDMRAQHSTQMHERSKHHVNYATSNTARAGCADVSGNYTPQSDTRMSATRHSIWQRPLRLPLLRGPITHPSLCSACSCAHALVTLTDSYMTPRDMTASTAWAFIKVAHTRSLRDQIGLGSIYTSHSLAGQFPSAPQAIQCLTPLNHAICSVRL